MTDEDFTQWWTEFDQSRTMKDRLRAGVEGARHMVANFSKEQVSFDLNDLREAIQNLKIFLGEKP